MDELFVEGPPPSMSPWATKPEASSGILEGSLALDDFMLQDLLSALERPGPRSHLVDHTSQHRVPPNIYPMFFRVPPVDDHIGILYNPRGIVTSAVVNDHRTVVKGLWESLMAAWHLKYHSSCLILFLQRFLMPDVDSQVALDALLKLMEEQ